MKGKLIILLLVTLLLLVGVANAADTNTDGINSDISDSISTDAPVVNEVAVQEKQSVSIEDTNTVEKINKKQETGPTSQITTTKNIQKNMNNLKKDTTVSSWEALESEINSATENTTITLTEGTYTVTDRIDFNKAITITIDGNGQTINGNQKQVFYIDSGSSLILKNITIKNAENNGGYGGAIYNNGNLTIINSTLTNNTATGEYGRGGVVYNNGTLNITGSNLTDNHATGQDYGSGGAIYNIGGTLNITQSNLTQNTATGQNYGYGGAIYNIDGILNVTGSYLTLNTVTGETYGYGGAIFNSNRGIITVTNSNLTQNNATGQNENGRGGAISNNDAGTLTIIQSNLNNNTATGQNGFGGAISNKDNGVLNITDSNFTNNKATGQDAYGGAIYYISQNTLTNITSSNFINNTAKNGAAIRADGNINLTGNSFTNNTADNNESIDLHNNNGLFNGNVYKSTDIALNENSLSIKDNQKIFTTNEDVVLNFTIALEHPNNYDSDLLERLEDITIYVNGMEYATTGYENLTLSGLELGEYTVGYKTCNQESNNVTFKVISERLTKTTVEILSNDWKNVTIKTMTTDTDDIAVTNGTIIVMDMDKNVLTTMNVTDGVAVIVIPVSQPGKLELVVEYQENDYYHASYAVNSSAIGTPYENVTIINAIKAKTIITLSDVGGSAGETVTITANVTDINGDMVTGGKVVFKVNGKTLKDDNGKVIYVKVVNGMASIQWTIPEEFINKNVTIAATYSGSTMYDKSNTTITTTATKEVPTITTSDITAAKGETITLTATITYKDNVINNGKVVFKINGKTVKDNNGKVIYVRVIDGMATVEYTIPESMKSKDYTLTAIFISTNFDNVEDTKTLTIN